MWLEALRDNKTTHGYLDGQAADPTIVDTAISDGEMSQRVAFKLGQALTQLHNGDTRHDATCKNVLGLLRCGKQGEPGVKPALTTLHKAFCDVAEATNRPGGRERAKTEFREFIYQKVNGRWVPSDKVAELLAQPDYDDWTTQIGQPDSDDQGSDQASGQSHIDPAEGAIQHRLHVLRINREAQRRLDAENRPALTLPPVQPFADWINRPISPIGYRIDKLAPVNARNLLAAQFKAGKTSLVGNLARALADHELFLNHFAVNIPAEHLVVIDDELDEDMLQAWMVAQKIQNIGAVAEVIPLRGRVASFNILDDHTRDQWVRRLADHGCDYLILDCLRPVLDACGLDESRDTGQFLLAYDELLSQAGIGDSTVVHHMGHSNERSRGDSRLLDWPDVLWKIVRETDDPASDRYFSAYGRGVNVPEGRLSYDDATHHLVYVGGSRARAKTETALNAVIALLVENAKTGGDDLSGRAIERALGYGELTQKAIRDAIKLGIDKKWVAPAPGPRGSRLHRIANPCGMCGFPLAVGQDSSHLACGRGDS